MIFSEFNSIVAQALTPITLISGVGILMLCMTARYNHATERIRQLMEKREAKSTSFSTARPSCVPPPSRSCSRPSARV